MNYLKTVRKNSNLTQADVAGVMGLTQATIAELENGIRSPRERTRRKLEGLLGPIDWKQTLVGAERRHLMFAIRAFVNPEVECAKERIHFTRQALKMIEDTLIIYDYENT